MADAVTDTQNSTTTDQTATTDAGASTEGAASATTTTEGAAPADAGTTADDSTLLGATTTGAGSGDAADKAGEGAATAAAGADAAVVPETYELKLSTTNEAGEATEVPLDPVLVEAATPLLKDVGLTNEQANKLLPLVPRVQEQILKQQSDEFAKVRGDWDKQVRTDPELGGAKLDETKRLAAVALDRFGAPSKLDADGNETNEFRKLLNETGLGNHPVMVRMFRDIGAAASEDPTFVRNTTETVAVKSREERNYPNDVPKTS